MSPKTFDRVARWIYPFLTFAGLACALSTGGMEGWLEIVMLAISAVFIVGGFILSTIARMRLVENIDVLLYKLRLKEKPMSVEELQKELGL